MHEYSLYFLYEHGDTQIIFFRTSIHTRPAIYVLSFQYTTNLTV